MHPDADDDDAGAAPQTTQTLHRRSRGGSWQDLMQAEETITKRKPSPPSSSPPPPPLSTARPFFQRPLSSRVLLLLLFGLASMAAVAGGLHLVLHVRRIGRGGWSSQAAAAAVAAAAEPPQQHQQQHRPPPPPDPNTPHHITVAIADLHGDWPHAVVALRAAGVLSDAGARALPTPSEAEREWRLPSAHALPREAGALFDLGQLGGGGTGGAGGGGVGGGTLHLVQTGDLVDRGRHGLALVRLFGALRDVARSSSNADTDADADADTKQTVTKRATVALLLGNHEMLNLQGEAARYAHAAELRAVAAAEKEEKCNSKEATAGKPKKDGAAAWARLMAAGGDLGDALRGDRAVAHVAGQGPCRTLFVHAGLTPGLLADLEKRAGTGAGAAAAKATTKDDGHGHDDGDTEGQPEAVRAINRAAAAALGECSGSGSSNNDAANADGGGCPRDIGARHPLGPLLLSGQGPVWTRALAPDGRGGAYRSNGQLALVCAAVDDVLRRVGGGGGGGGGDGDEAEAAATGGGAPRRMVVGHTITRTDGSPTVACGGRLVFLDVGMSSAMWGSDDEQEGEEEEQEGQGQAASPPFAGPSPALALRCEFGGPEAKPGAAELVFARPKRGHERDDPRTTPLDVRRMPLPALGAVSRLGVAAVAG